MTPSFTTPPPQPSPKLHLSNTALPPYISPSQPPTKKPPFRQINSVPFIQTTSFILPEELYELIISNLPQSLLSPRYAKLICPLSAFLEGKVFTECIKRPGSDLLALSEGKPGVDDKFSLCAGILRMDLGKEAYQRAGLQGQVLKETGARKHVKSRWRVDVDLRAPGSVQGKKGFDKLKAAASKEGALGKGRCWLVADAEAVRDESEVGGLEGEAIRGLHPTMCAAKKEVKSMERVLVPDRLISGQRHELDEEEWWELVEWVDLVALGSPRVMENDKVDSYISRYSVPEPTVTRNLKVMKWEGLMSSEWLTRLLTEVIKQSRISKSKDWVALSVTGHATEAVGGIDGYTIVLQPSESRTQKTEHEKQLQPEAMDLDEKTGDRIGMEGAGLQHCDCFQFIDSVMA